MSAGAVARARACVGARFRLHGREAAYGLDCVGLAAAAHGLARVPAGYPLRGGDVARIAAGLRDAGFAEVAEAAPGDVLLIAAAAFQPHLAIRTERGFIHADAALRRVVEVPGPPRWPVLSCWRRG